MWRKSARRDFLKGYYRAATQKSATLTIVGWSGSGHQLTFASRNGPHRTLTDGASSQE
jgi:hypothetical protein